MFQNNQGEKSFDWNKHVSEQHWIPCFMLDMNKRSMPTVFLKQIWVS